VHVSRRWHRSIVLAVLAVVACGQDKVASPRQDTVAAIAAFAPAPMAAVAFKKADSRAKEMASPAPQPPQAMQQMVIRTADMRIRVKAMDSTMRLIERIARMRGAVVADARATRNAETKQGDATLTIRVPAERFDETISDLRGLGEVLSDVVTADDITKAYADLETRTAVKTQTVARLEALLNNRTAKLGEVLEVERELARAVTELEQMKGERRYYEHQVALSSISLVLSEPIVVTPPSLGAPVAVALKRSLEALTVSFTWAVYLITFLTPWILVVWLVWWTFSRTQGRWPIRPERRILDS
jgi:hypothetical protein